MTKNMLKIAKYWENCFEPKPQHHKKNRIVWATQFTKLLHLSNQEKKLKPEAAIVYKNPPTLATKLTIYKKFYHKFFLKARLQPFTVLFSFSAILVCFIDAQIHSCF